MLARSQAHHCVWHIWTNIVRLYGSFVRFPLFGLGRFGRSKLSNAAHAQRKRTIASQHEFPNHQPAILFWMCIYVCYVCAWMCHMSQHALDVDAVAVAAAPPSHTHQISTIVVRRIYVTYYPFGDDLLSHDKQPYACILHTFNYVSECSTHRSHIDDAIPNLSCMRSTHVPIWIFIDSAALKITNKE